MISAHRASLLALLLASLTACRAGSAFDIVPLPRPARTVRGMWVTRFDYRTERDVVDVVERCDRLGIDTILFQVRGNATAFYRSSVEPWAAELGGRDPGFDPLDVALREAKARGIRLQAWVNVVPAWWGTAPPEDPAQLYNARPEWMWYDQAGRRQALSDRFYVSVNPCLPEVRDYLVLVLEDLVARYPVDGLHLDYLRFPNEAPGTPAGSGIDYPRDPRTLELFLGETGLSPDQDRAAWDAWRAEQVTNLLRDIRYMVERTRPEVELTAAVGPEPEVALREHHQDVATWLEEGLIDRAFPMSYASDPRIFDRRIELWRELAPRSRVVLGIRADSGPPEAVLAQIETARAHFSGFCLFAYQTLYDGPNETLTGQDAAARFARSERRKVFAPYLRSLR